MSKLSNFLWVTIFFKNFFLLICVCVRESDTDLLFHPLMHLLFDSCLCPDRVQTSTLAHRDDALTNWTTQSGLNFIFIFLKDFIYLFLREGKRGRKRERNINVWMPLMRPLLGTWPATQACALDWESEPATLWFTSWQSTTEPHQPRAQFYF